MGGAIGGIFIGIAFLSFQGRTNLSERLRGDDDTAIVTRVSTSAGFHGGSKLARSPARVGFDPLWRCGVTSNHIQHAIDQVDRFKAGMKIL